MSKGAHSLSLMSKGSSTGSPAIRRMAAMEILETGTPLVLHSTATPLCSSGDHKKEEETPGRLPPWPITRQDSSLVIARPKPYFHP